MQLSKTDMGTKPGVTKPKRSRSFYWITKLKPKPKLYLFVEHEAEVEAEALTFWNHEAEAEAEAEALYRNAFKLMRSFYEALFF